MYNFKSYFKYSTQFENQLQGLNFVNFLIDSNMSYSNKHFITRTLHLDSRIQIYILFITTLIHTNGLESVYILSPLY